MGMRYDEVMRYPLANLGQAGQNLIYSKDFNAFYETALGAAGAIADVARSKDLSDLELSRVNQELGKIRDYTVPMAPAQASPAPCPPAAAPSEGNAPVLLVAAGALAGLAIGAFLL